MRRAPLPVLALLLALTALPALGQIPLFPAPGIVLSEDGGPLSGVAIRLNGNLTEVLTDENGEYTLQLPAGVHHVSPTLAGWEFDPSAVEVIVNPFNPTPAEVFVGVSLAPPATPTNLEALEIKRKSVILAWKDESDDEVNFLLMVSTDGGNNFRQLTFAPANRQSLRVLQLRPKKRYWFRVQAIGRHAQSGFSNVLAVKTKK